MRVEMRLLVICLATAGLTTSAKAQVFGYGGYSLVKAQPRSVGDGSMIVSPPREWNKKSTVWALDDVRQVEDWTLNGPYLDSLSFVTGLKSGRHIIRQRKRDAQQVPAFRSDMTAPEIAAMLESFYRVKADAIDFKSTGLIPRQFMGYPGFQFDFDHLDSDEVWRRGRAVGAVIDDRLYLTLLDGARSHYFAAALPDFEVVANSARFKR